MPDDVRDEAHSRMFHEAEQHEAELNDRQRQVLDLVVEGKTNGEIAERLGMTLDGAKWNVSEVLSKLGLSSRNEAADYWRWRNRLPRRLGRVARALAPATALKWAAGSGAVLAGIAAVSILAFAADDPSDPGTGDADERSSFYLEAEIVVESNARTVGSQIAGEATPSPRQPHTTVTHLRWWNLSLDEYRVEFNVQPEGEPAGRMVIVGDGEYIWSTIEGSGEYARDELWPLPDGWIARPIPMSIALGPIAVDGPQPAVDDAITWIMGMASETLSVVPKGQETVLGYDVQVIEYGPTWSSSSSSADADGSGTPNATVTRGGTARIWVDPETHFILRAEGDNGETGSYSAELTTLEFTDEFDGDLFVFEPPPGATESTDSSGD